MVKENLTRLHILIAVLGCFLNMLFSSGILFENSSPTAIMQFFSAASKLLVLTMDFICQGLLFAVLNVGASKGR